MAELVKISEYYNFFGWSLTVRKASTPSSPLPLHAPASSSLYIILLLFFSLFLFLPFQVKIDPKSYFENEISVTKNLNLKKLAKAGTVVDKSE